MGRRRIVVLLCLTFLVSACENQLYTSLVSEIGLEKAASGSFLPCKSCIDVETPISVVFEKSMDVSTLEFSGSLAESTKSFSWSTTNVENDTVTFVPEEKWKADSTIAATIGSLYITAKDTDGWDCEQIVWTPEILDGVIYINGTTGVDSDDCGGGISKPFNTIKYGMRAARILYFDKNPIIRIAEGGYACETDQGSLVIDFPCSIYGGYKKDDWCKRNTDEYETLIKTNFFGHYATVIIHANNCLLDGLTVGRAVSESTTINGYTACCLTLLGSAECLVNDCTIELSYNVNYPSLNRAISTAENTVLNISNSIVNGVAKLDGSSLISCMGRLIAHNTSFLYYDTFADENIDTTGILMMSDSELYSCVFYIQTTNKETCETTAIVVSNSDNEVKGSIKYCKIYTSVSFGYKDYKAITLAGIQSSGFVIEGNYLSNNCNSCHDDGIYVANCNNIEICNNYIRCSDGGNTLAVSIFKSNGVLIKSNTIATGFATHIPENSSYPVKGYAVYLCDQSSVTECSGNIFYSDTTLNENLKCTGIVLNSEQDIVEKMDSNVFAGFNNCMLGVYSTLKGYHNTQEGLEKLQTEYPAYTNNIMYEDVSDLNLTSDTTEYNSSARTGPLMPTDLTPIEIRQSSTLEIENDCDIFLKERTAPYSIGCYEVD